MQDQLADILAYAYGVVRHKWIIIIFASVISLVGWAYVYTMPNKFTSEARVYVDTRTMLRPLLKGIAVQSDVRGLVTIMKKLMFTQENLLKVAKLAGLDGEYSSNKGRFDLTNILKEEMSISGGREEIFSIKYNSKSPLEAQQVVQAVLSVFSEQTQSSSQSDAGSAQRFIEEQIREYERRLRNSEQAMEKFKRANIGLLPGEGGNQVGRLQEIHAEMEQIELTISELKAKRSVLNAQMQEAFESEDEWGLTDIGDETLTEEEQRIQNLLEQKDGLLIKYTENHPYVKAIDSTIGELEKKIAQQSEELFDGDEGSLEAMSNPYVQKIKSEINQVDAEIATLRSRAERMEQKLVKVDDEFNMRLKVETEMQNLNRDYNTIKKNYVSMLQRREQANLSNRVDDQASALKFKIADPANRPIEPSAPNRPLLYSVVFLSSVIIGIGIALLLVLMRPVFSSPRDLRALTGLPVLGSVSNFHNAEEVKKQKINNLMFISIGVLLLLCYSGIMTMDLFFGSN